MHMRPFGSHCCLYLPIDLWSLLPSDPTNLPLFPPVKSSLTVAAAAASIVYCFYAIVCLLP